MVRELGLTPESLGQLLKNLKKSPAETFQHITENTEDKSDEEN